MAREKHLALSATRAQTSGCSLLLGGGHATAEMVMQWRALKEHWIANNQVDILAKQGAASGGPPQALIGAYLERAETTRRHQEIATAILEERDHLEDIAPQAEQDPGVTDEERDVQKPVFFQAMEGRASHQALGWMQNPR